MTLTEFLSEIKSRGAILAPGADMRGLDIANNILQRQKSAIIPHAIAEFYAVAGGAYLDTGYIFGPGEIQRTIHYPVPSIIQINTDLAGMPQMYGKTMFGRNDLFWFAFDAFGKCEMLDNVNLRPLRRYDDAYRAMFDCLMGGKC